MISKNLCILWNFLQASVTVISLVYFLAYGFYLGFVLVVATPLSVTCCVVLLLLTGIFSFYQEYKADLNRHTPKLFKTEYLQ